MRILSLPLFYSTWTKVNIFHWKNWKTHAQWCILFRWKTFSSAENTILVYSLRAKYSSIKKLKTLAQRNMFFRIQRDFRKFWEFLSFFMILRDFRGFKRILGMVWKIQNFGHMSKLGLPYLLSTQLWTKIGLDKYSYCLPYLPIQKVWSFSNHSVFLKVHFLTFVMILFVNIQVRYH